MADLLAAVNIVGIDAGLVERAQLLPSSKNSAATTRCTAPQRKPSDPALVVASGDRRLLAALSAVGLDTVDTSVR